MIRRKDMHNNRYDRGQAQKAEKRSARNSRIPWSAIALAFLFMFNPYISIVDPLPDVIGYIILCCSLVKYITKIFHSLVLLIFIAERIRPATSNFRAFRQSSSCKICILLQLALTKFIENCNVGGCFAVLSEQIFCRCKEKMRSNI